MNAVTILDDSRLGFPSASGMDRIFACSGSWIGEQIVAQQPNIKDGGKYSQHGIELHRANQTGDLTELDEDDTDTIVAVRATEEKLVTEWLNETDSKIEDVTVYRELRLWCASFSGQADTLVVNERNKRAVIFDLKTGRRKVAPSSKNWQLRSLAVLVMERFGVESVRTVIIQPMVEAHAACEYSKEHLIVARDRIVERLQHIMTPGLPRTAGTHCTYCKALPTCKEAHRNMSVAIRAVNLRWDLSTQEDKLRLYKAATIAKECSEQIISLCRADLAADPDSIKGLVKARDSHPRSIKDLPGVVRAAQPDGLSLDPCDENEFLWEWIEMAKVSVGDLEKFLMARHGWTKKQAKDWITAHPDLIVEETRSGKISVVEEDLPLVNVAQGELANALPKGTTVVRA